MKKTSAFDHKGKSYNQIILENQEDMLLYYLAAFDRDTSKSAQMWYDMAESGMKPMKFITHCGHSYGPAPRLFSAITIRNEGNPVDAQTFSTELSKCLSGMYATMQRLINEGNVVRVNNMGGYCYYPSCDDVETPLEECSVIDMKQFVSTGNFKTPIVTGDILIIENDYDVNYDFKQEVERVFDGNVSTLTNIKNQPSLTDILIQAFKSNLKVIAFESTGMDVNQVRSVKKLLESLTEKMEKHITVYAKVASDLQGMYHTDSEYINLRFAGE